MGQRCLFFVFEVGESPWCQRGERVGEFCCELVGELVGKVVGEVRRSEPWEQINKIKKL